MSGALGVVGFGRMARALVLPWIESGLVSADAVRAVVGSESSAREAHREHPALTISTVAREAWACPVVLLAVKPQQLESVAAEAARHAAGEEIAAVAPSAPGPAGRPGRLLVSVLAGVRRATLQALFPGWTCVRAVPNTPALVGAGLTGLAWGEEITQAQREWLLRLFSRVGEVLELPEAQMDAFLALTSSGPAFLALVAEAMADGAVAAGLPRAMAHHLTHRTLAGTAALLHDRELHPGQLKDLVSSPAGTTIAGLRQLERAGLRSALLEAVLAAAERSRELG